MEELNGYGTMRPRNIISSILSGTPAKNKGLAISNPHDFRMVSYSYNSGVVIGPTKWADDGLVKVARSTEPVAVATFRGGP